MANTYNGPAPIKLYFKKTDAVQRIIEAVYNGELNVHVKISPKDYVCVEIYKNKIEIITDLTELGLEEYKFPERNK